MSKYIRFSRSDLSGSYIQPLSKISEAVQTEFEYMDEIESGTIISLEVVDMTEQEYENLPEFTGW